MDSAQSTTASEILSGAPSVVSSAVPSCCNSAVPSRSNSPTGSDATGRRTSLPMAVVAAVVEPIEVESSVSATSESTPRESKGKGKGKGKGKASISGPPPPPIGLTPRLSIVKPVARPSKYVNLYWKATHAPEPVDLDALENDPFLARLRDASLQDDLCNSACRDALQDSLPAHQTPKIPLPALSEKIFSADVEVPKMPEEMLEDYFKRCEVAVRMTQVDSKKTKQGTDGREDFIRDPKRIQMIGIMMQKHIMQHKERSNREAILNIKRGVLRCDFTIVKLECLSVIRIALRQHAQDGSPLTSHVQARGEAAIWDLAFPDHHYLIYELSKVPQIDERLECMLFQLQFRENMVACKWNLQTLSKALAALQAKRDLIRRLFVTAHRLGQSLSQKQSRGFQLSTLEKLTQTKSTKMPSLNILHFVLALMSREDAHELFTDDDIALLRGAKALGTAKVCDECRELAQGLYDAKQIFESGEYKCQSTGQSVKIERRRKTLVPGMQGEAHEAQEPTIDTDDCFHENMQHFVESHVDEADGISVECHKMVLMYKELALFFDDLNSVYPPPKEPSDKKLDLVDVFYRFAKVVPQHRQEVEDECLRGKIGKDECLRGVRL